MAKYRKIDPRIWNDRKFRELSDDGQLAFLFVLTHPHMTMLGAMRASISGLAEEKGWTVERMRKALGEAFQKALLKVDSEASFLWAANFLRYNKPESPNVVKSWESALNLLPECELKDQLIQQVKGFAEGLGKGFQEALPEAFAKAMPNQEQEQEQEQEQKNTSCAEPSDDGPRTDESEDPSGPVLMQFPCKGNPNQWPLHQSKLREYEETFPDIDIIAECRKARQWCVDNPRKRKTTGGMTRFLSSWITSANNKGTAALRDGPEQSDGRKFCEPRNPTKEDLQVAEGVA